MLDAGLDHRAIDGGRQGGVVERVKSGYAIVSFSGGKSEDDVQVSKAGLEVLQSLLRL